MKKLYAKYISLLFILFAISSCEIINPAEDVPSYIHINKFSLTTNYTTQGDSTNALTDAWVYVDNVTIGAFELPATIPILNSGTHSIKIMPGVKLNGNPLTRYNNIFYQTYEESINLTKGKTLTINPKTTYNSTVNFVFIEDFEKAGIIFAKSAGSDTSIVTVNQNISNFNKHYGAVNITPTDTTFICNTNNDYILPFHQTPIMLEFDYYSNCNFSVGIIANEPTLVTQDEILQIPASNGWTKIYVNLLTTVNNYQDASGFKIYFNMHSATSKFLYLDNIKLLTF